MKSIEEWDRFMRFMERFARTHELTFKLSASVENVHLAVSDELRNSVRIELKGEPESVDEYIHYLPLPNSDDPSLFL